MVEAIYIAAVILVMKEDKYYSLLFKTLVILYKEEQGRSNIFYCNKNYIKVTKKERRKEKQHKRKEERKKYIKKERRRS